MKSSILAIVNPKAGLLRDKSRLVADFVHLFDKNQSEFVHFQIVETEFPGHATQLAKQAAESGFGMCMAIGGDGTMNEVARGLIFSQTSLGIIPIGSGNGLARHLGISMNPREAFLQMIAGKDQVIDSGLANGNPFFLATGIGFEGTVAHEFGKQKSRGFSQYIQSAAKAFFSFKPLTLSWELDGHREVSEVFTMTLANGSQYGNNARISPSSSVCDGWLNRVVVSDFRFWQGPGLFYRLMAGRFEEDRIYSNKKFHSLVLKSDKDLFGHLDGEPMIWTNGLLVQIVPNSLIVRVPVGVSDF